MKPKPKYSPALLFVVLLAGILIGKLANFVENYSQFSLSNPPTTKLNKLIEFINNEYVDSVNTDSIVDSAIGNILEKLDPHSVYVPPSEQSQVAESMKGDFVGIGINFYQYNDTVAIIKTIEGGPSEKAGLQSGDRILFAGSDKLFGRNLPTDSLYAKLKGKIDSEVLLTVYRKSEKRIFKRTIKRDVVPIKSVDIGMKLDKSVGYIKINRFSETTYQEFIDHLFTLKNNGMKSLVIDLRDNGGGYMQEAVKIADELLPGKKLIVFTKNKKGEVEKSYTEFEGSFEQGAVFVLINENSASASEILAGAIQDNDRGTIIGRRSFGKGLVQREMSFDDGSAVRLTIARYYTPTGRSIQRPYKDGSDAYSEEFNKRLHNGEFHKKDSIKQDKTRQYKTPKGKTVYGGGGIVPDLFVPLPVAQGNEEVIYLMESGLVSYFVFEQIDRDRNAFSKLDYNQFLRKMEKETKIVQQFQKYAEANGAIIQLEPYKEIAKKYLIAEFARQLFEEQDYFTVILKEDPMIKVVMDQVK